ncbi:unnamed protein product [Bemisia tabaci]|uniref:Uncharacterized protein n=1 Tax=Bemisia tabaci TaxID=7038 RepID=A0A9P0EWD8_BEMTA|nr:unnamed protein product [Bemisia tabaci]
MSGVNSPVRLIRVVDKNGTEEGEKGGGAGAPQGDKETANNLYNRVLSESKAPPPLSMLGIKKNSKTSPAFLTEKYLATMSRCMCMSVIIIFAPWQFPSIQLKMGGRDRLER